MPSSEEIRHLDEFLKAVHEDLDWVVNGDGQYLLDEFTREAAQGESWNSISTLIHNSQSLLQNLGEAVGVAVERTKVTQPTSQQVHEELRYVVEEQDFTSARQPHGENLLEVYDRLEMYGFSGSLVGIKLAGWQRARDALWGAIWSLAGKLPHPSSLAQAVKVAFTKLLRWIDLLLGSLVKAITWLDPVKEFKETIEQTIVA